MEIERKNSTEEHRVHWENKLEYWLSCIGYAVGYGSIWRFPFLVFSNGGGAFLIPYLTCLLLAGIPMVYYESAISQFFQKNLIKMWATIRPHYQYLGYMQVSIAYLVSTFYNVLLTYSYIYFFSSFQNPLPWSLKDNQQFTKEDLQYFDNVVLQKTSSIKEMGGINYNAFTCFFISLIVVFLCIRKGIKTSGKVVYISAPLPYLLLFILLLKGVSLEGAITGIKFLLIPDIKKLFSVDVWMSALVQVIFQMSIAQGLVITLAQFKHKNEDILKSSIGVPLINAFTGLLGSFTVFSFMGFMSHQLNIPIDQLPLSGPGLAFRAYPVALSLMPASSFWSILFFLTLILLGLDSQFTLLETVCDFFISEKIKLFGRNISSEMYRLLIVFSTLFIGFPMYTQAGIYYLELYDQFICNIPFVLSLLFEIIIFGYVINQSEFSQQMKQYTGAATPSWIQFSVKSILPFFASALLLGVIHKVVFKILPEYNGFQLLLGLTLLLVPLCILFKPLISPSRNHQQLIPNSTEIELIIRAKK